MNPFALAAGDYNSQTAAHLTFAKENAAHLRASANG
jgi:hypothetical protein